MPGQETPERVTLWVPGGRVLMQPLAAGVAEGGAIPNGGFRGCLRSSASLRYSLGNVRFRKKLPFRGYPLDVVFAAEPAVRAFDQEDTFSSPKNPGTMAGAVTALIDQYCIH